MEKTLTISLAEYEQMKEKIEELEKGRGKYISELYGEIARLGRELKKERRRADMVEDNLASWLE